MCLVWKTTRAYGEVSKEMASSGPHKPTQLGRTESHFSLSCHPELLSVLSFCFLTGNRDHQETHLKIICGTQKEREKVVGTFQQASLKTSLGTTKCMLSICICDVSEAELPLRYVFSRTTFSHVRQGTTVNHMCRRERPSGYVQYLFPFVSCFPPPLFY